KRLARDQRVAGVDLATLEQLAPRAHQLLADRREVVVRRGEAGEALRDARGRAGAIAGNRGVDGRVEVAERLHDLRVGLAIVTIERGAATLEVLAERSGRVNRETEEALYGNTHDLFSQSRGVVGKRVETRVRRENWDGRPAAAAGA